MTSWKQAALTLVAVAATLVLWAIYVPAAAPFLARIGVLGTLQHLGIAAEEVVADKGVRQRPEALAPVVIAVPPSQVRLSDPIAAIGSARALRSVSLTPEVTARIEAMHVRSGDFVAAGAMIAQLESTAQHIEVDRASLLLRHARAATDRLARLQATGSATDLQSQEAELAVKSAELALREAELALSQHRLVAPISGWVGILSIGVGDQVSPGIEVTTIDDRSSLIVEFRVPERIVAKLAVGHPVTATPLARGELSLAGKIVAMDNRVDEASRTLRVQAAIGNDGDRLRPGMAFAIEMDFPGEEHPAVDPLAIQWGSAGAFVWVVRDGKADRLPVRIVQRNSDLVLIAADLRQGDLIVTEGFQSLRPGTAVEVSVPQGAVGAARPSHDPAKT